ncbi:MAG: hypothetical protein RLN75_00615 [Longimicrobiales bacterium]
MTVPPPTSPETEGPADAEVDRDRGRFLLDRAPDLTQIWRRRLGEEAPELFDRDGPVDDAARELTEAVAVCGVGAIREDFQARTRASLATLVGAWRRASLAEHRLADTLGRLGDHMVEELASVPVGTTATRARAAACVLDATQILIRRAERTFRSWRDRTEAEDTLSVAIFGETLAHEIRNRIHAAETALRLLQSADGATLSADERGRLHRLLLDAVVATRRAVYDVRLVTAQDDTDRPSVTAPLHELVRRTVDQVQVVAREKGVEIALPGPIPVVYVEARHVQIVLNNILGVAVRLLAGMGGTTLRVEARHPTDRSYVEMTFRGDRRFLEDGHEEVLFEADLADLADNGDHTGPDRLGLWLTREAVEQMGGDLDVVDEAGEHPGALIVRVPVAAPRDPSS